MPKGFPRRVANWLLRSAVRIAPDDTQDWGQAMLSELLHLKGDWAALLWAIGGAGVLAKHVFVSFFVSSGGRPNAWSGEGLLEKEGAMRKGVLWAVGACVLGSALFLLAPAFRRALRVSLASWGEVAHVQSPSRRVSPEFNALARNAEQDQDAEALAFVAVRHSDLRESERLAEEAVRLDARLTWIYGVVAVRNPEIRPIDKWVSQLAQWDPQNALPYFIQAESMDIDEATRDDIRHRLEQKSPAWKEAMAAAFVSPKLDNYLERLKELDRRVLLRYGVNDPYQAIYDARWHGLPSYTAWESSRYARSILESAEKLEAQGDRSGAARQYWAVARFGQMMGSAGGILLRRVVRDAYRDLAALSERAGRKGEAPFYASLAAQMDLAAHEENMAFHNGLRGGDLARWNAFWVRASGLGMLASIGLLLTSALAVTARARPLRLRSLRPGPLSLGLGLCGAIGSLLFSAVLYVSYHPYADILERFIRTGDDSGFPQVSEFLVYAQNPLGAEYFRYLPDFIFYFWFAVTSLCAVALATAVVLRLRGRARAASAV